MPRINAAIAIVVRNQRVLICQRKDQDHLGGYWEFPGGKCEEGETLERCIRRELLEEVNITARPIARLGTIDHDYPHARVRLHPFICIHEACEPQPRECQAALWVDPCDLHKYKFPPANEKLIAEVMQYFSTDRTPPREI